MFTYKLFLKISAIFLLFGIFIDSHAIVVGVTVDTNKTQLQDNRNNSVSITWSGFSGLNAPAMDINGVVFSNTGTFLLPSGTVVLGRDNARLDANVSIGPNSPAVPFTIRENLQIPKSIIYAAKKQGALVIQYQRNFADTFGGQSETATVQFQIVSSSRGELNISRLDLRFDNEQITRVVPIGEQLSAVADINYSGVGLFDYAWEIATPASTQGEAFFSTLKINRKYLSAGREAYIQSPKLPTDTTGTYFIRLNIRSPQTGFEPVLIKYVVIKSDKGIEPINFEKINLLNPLPKAVLQKNTKFDWQPIDKANAYQLEIFEYLEGNEHPESVRSLEDIEIKQDWEKTTKERSTGILVHGDKHTVGLSPIARQHLKPGYKYRWRVIAIDVKGRIIATSSLRTIHYPK